MMNDDDVKYVHLIFNHCTTPGPMEIFLPLLPMCSKDAILHNKEAAARDVALPAIQRFGGRRNTGMRLLPLPRFLAQMKAEQSNLKIAALDFGTKRMGVSHDFLTSCKPYLILADTSTILFVYRHLIFFAFSG